MTSGTKCVNAKRNVPFMLQRVNGEPAALTMPAVGQYAPRLTRPH